MTRGSESCIIKSEVNPATPIDEEKPDSNWMMMIMMTY